MNTTKKRKKIGVFLAIVNFSLLAACSSQTYKSKYEAKEACSLWNDEGREVIFRGKVLDGPWMENRVWSRECKLEQESNQFLGLEQDTNKPYNYKAVVRRFRF